MPVHNAEHFVEAAIKSILKQSSSNFELVVWDDGSTDSSLKIALSFAQNDPRVKVFTAHHQGVAASVNAAIAQSTGTYLGIVDSDDLLAPTALSETQSLLEAHPSIGLVYTDYIVIDEHGEEKKYGGRCKLPYSKDNLLTDFMTFHFRLFRRAVFEQVGGMDESFASSEDYDLCLRLSEVTNFSHLPNPLYYYRSHSNNTSHRNREKQDFYAREAVKKAKKRRKISVPTEPAFDVEKDLDLEKSLQTTKPIALVAHHPVTKHLNFYWSLEKQLFACDDIYYQNEGPAGTEPSHDLVHLVVAASGNLAWLPYQQRELSCLAEYNAVLLETLFDRTCSLLIFGTVATQNLWAVVQQHMAWFVEQHFAPFPLSKQEAYQQFCSQIDPFVVSQLFPYYLSMKQYERSHPDYREAEYQLSFTSTDQPPTDEAGWLAQWFIYQHLKTAQASCMNETRQTS